MPVYPIGITHRDRSDAGARRCYHAMAAIADCPISWFQFFDLKNFNFQRGDQFKMHVRQGADAIYSYSKPNHVMLVLREPLDAS